MPGVDSFGFGAAPEQPTLDGFEEVPVTGGSTVATDSPSKKKKKKAGEDGKIEAWRKKTIPLDHAGISEYLHFDCGTSSHLRHQLRAVAMMFAFIAFCLGIVVLIASLSDPMGWVNDSSSSYDTSITRFVEQVSSYEANFVPANEKTTTLLGSSKPQRSCSYYIRDSGSRDSESKLFPVGSVFVIIGFLLVLNGMLMLGFSNYGKLSSANVKWVFLVAGILMMVPGMLQDPHEPMHRPPYTGCSSHLTTVPTTWSTTTRTITTDPSKSSDGSSCSSGDSCASGTCRGGYCCSNKGKSTGCTSCYPDDGYARDGDCKSCASGFYMKNLECVRDGGDDDDGRSAGSSYAYDRYCSSCYSGSALVPIDSITSSAKTLSSRSATSEKRCVGVRARTSSSKYKGDNGEVSERIMAYSFYLKAMDAHGCTDVGGHSIACGILLWITAFVIWLAGPEETDQELAGWQGKLWSCCSWFCAYPGLCKCWEWGCATACPVDPDFESYDGGESGTSAGPMSLRLPKKLAGNPPPIFIDNQPAKTTLSSNGFGEQMLTQHTMRKRSCCCNCCQSQLGAVPVDYAVAGGKASNKSLVRLRGKYNIIESCSCAGLAPACSPACRKAFCLCCYKDKSTFTFGLDGKDTYTVKYGAEKDSAEYLSVESDGVTTTTVVDHTLGCCTHCKNTCCTAEYEEYPVEIKDSTGKVVLTQRIKYVGCCGPCKAMMKCHCKTCCNSCGALFGNCGFGSCCSDDCGETCCPSCSCCGKETEKEAKVKGECCDESGGCCGCCIEGGSCHSACQKCGCCIPKKCGGQCCERSGPCCGCGKIQWMEPFELNGAEFYGPPEDKSGKVVAKITHKMNMTKTLQCWCCTSSELSNVYHTEIDMPANYAESEWQGLLGWNLIMDHMDLIMPMFGGAVSNCLNPKAPRGDKDSK